MGRRMAMRRNNHDIGGYTGDATKVCIRALTSDELRAAATMLADGMLDNPLHVKVFGVDRKRRQQRLLRLLGPLVGYVHANGEVQGAYVQGKLIGVLGMIRPGRCHPMLSDRLSFTRALMISVPPITLLRIHRWLGAWARKDPDKPHWHIGPLTVLPEYRRRGIGRCLMLYCCRRMDALTATAWLETDLEINAAFYQTLGFVVARQEPVLGVPTWFMSRTAIRDTSADAMDRSRND